MAFTYETIEPTLIPNTTMVRSLLNGIPCSYRITPNENYVLHDSESDWTETDEDTGAQTIYFGYTKGTVSCSATYDFEANPREFYAVEEHDAVLTSEEATEEDYQEALREMGVNV